MRELAALYRYQFRHITWGGWTVLIVGPHGVGHAPDDGIGDFALGPIVDGEQAESAASDRFLRVRIDGDVLELSNDYVGSIPVFHTISGDVVSNVLPVVVGASGVGVEDLDPQDLVGLLVLSHPVWDETAFRSIRTMPPDVRARFEPGKVPGFQRKNTLRSIRRIVGAKEAAAELADLNRTLIRGALAERNVVLPLSAGYDSRLILGVLGKADSGSALRALTYGPDGSVDVEAARELAARAGVRWDRIELPCRFLQREYLEKIGAVFGGHLHFHGMYQIEFIESALGRLEGDDWIWTSGFMTGVPGGQHVGLLSGGGSVLDRMGAFSQSRVMPCDQLLKEVPTLAEGVERLRSRLERSYGWIEGDDDQRIVVADLLTRQRHFISYYPRVFEWHVDERSPHMNPRWANFFLALPPELLRDRRLVEIMFASHMPELARVISNSNGLRSPVDHGRNLLHYGALVLTRLGCGGLLPRSMRKNRMAFDGIASARAGGDGFWPAIPRAREWEWLETILPATMLERMARRAGLGDPAAIDWMSRIQAVAYDIWSVLE